MNNQGNWSGSSSAYNNASGWNGWQYQVPTQSQGQAQEPATTANSSPGGNNNVNYVQLNWSDILGGQQKAGAVTTTTGTSGMQLSNLNNATENSSGWTGTGFHQGGVQDDQRAAPTFRISVGNQGDQTMTPSGNNQPVGFQFGSGGDAGDQSQNRELAQSKPTPNQFRPKPLRIYKTVPKSSTEPISYIPWGKCPACEQQQQNKSEIKSNKAFLVRQSTKIINENQALQKSQSYAKMEMGNPEYVGESNEQ